MSPALSFAPPPSGFRFSVGRRLRRANRILPVFLPFAGCPARCVFCAQDRQTGVGNEGGVDRALERAAATLEEISACPPPGGVELAFYGGTFTALPAVRREAALALFARYSAQGPVTRGRCSTRPDALDAAASGSVLDRLAERGVTFPIRHCANSGAVLHYPCTYLDMVRPGIALYGHYPAPDCEGLDGPGLRPVMELKSRIAAVRALPAGTCVSYGRTCTLQRDSLLAVVPVGYADGLPRLCSNGLEMLVRGQRAPVVGRVCMDMCMVDVTDIPGVRPGDVATVYGSDGGETVTVEAAAERAGTIQYELLCAVSERVPRVYQG